MLNAASMPSTCARTSTARAQKEASAQAIGCSRGGLSTKIHATVDALGNPTGFVLTAGPASDLEGPMFCSRILMRSKEWLSPY